MAEFERFVRASGVTIDAADPRSEEARACIQAYFHELQERFDKGFDPDLTISANPKELVPTLGWFLIPRLDGKPVGCGALKIKDGNRGEIKRMWVAQSARGLGVAQRLLKSLEARAADAGVNVLRLDTHRNLTEARERSIRSAGYRLRLRPRHAARIFCRFTGSPCNDKTGTKERLGSGVFETFSGSSAPSIVPASPAPAHP